MKKLIAVSFVALMPSSNVMAEMSPKMYVGAGFGSTLNTDFNVNDEKWDHDSGVMSFSLMFGAELNEMFRVEGELSINGDSEYKIRDNTWNENYSQTYNQKSLMANGYFSVPTGSIIKPYFGLGVGFVKHSVDEIIDPDVGTTETNSKSGTNFAYQGMIGVDFALPNSPLTFGVEYKYLQTEFSEFSNTWDVNSQSVMATARYAF